MTRGDKVLVNGKQAVVRYSYHDLYCEGSHRQYRIAFLREKLNTGFFEPAIYDKSWYKESDLTKIGELTKAETEKAETLLGYDFAIDKERAKLRLTRDERDKFVTLVMLFYKLKKQKNHDHSDIVRKELQKWQRSLGDQDFLSMAETGEFIFVPFLRDN